MFKGRHATQTLSMKTLAAAIASLSLAAAASAIPYGFERITDNNKEDVAFQLTVEVDERAPGQIGFALANVGSIASIVTGLFFHDSLGLFKSGEVAEQSKGVSFQAGKKNANLPGGKPLGFETDLSFSRASKGGVGNGIDNAAFLSEFAVFSLTLAAGDLKSVLSALDDGSLRLGLHVQSIGSAKGSDSFVSSSRLGDGGNVNVPDSGSNLALAAVSLLALFATRRAIARRRENKA